MIVRKEECFDVLEERVLDIKLSVDRNVLLKMKYVYYTPLISTYLAIFQKCMYIKSFLNTHAVNNKITYSMTCKK